MLFTYSVSHRTAHILHVLYFRLVVEVLHLLATVLDKMQEIGDAEKVLERALSILIRINHTEYHEDVAQTYAKLGMLFFQSGNYPLSITYFKKALEIWMKKKGELY